MPAGLYPVRWRCLDAGGRLEFSGHYYVYGPEEMGRCDWLAWSATEALPEGGGRFEYAGQPPAFSILTLDPGTEEAVAVSFDNPYLLRIHVPGRPLVQRVVELTEGSFTDVRVTAEPAS